MTEVFTNIDARYLQDLAVDMEQGGETETAARLLTIARHIQALDEANATAFTQGQRAAEARIYGRSNVLPRAETGLPNAEVIARALASGKPVKKIPRGVSGEEAARRAEIAALAAEKPLAVNIDLKALGVEL